MKQLHFNQKCWRCYLACPSSMSVLDPAFKRLFIKLQSSSSSLLVGVVSNWWSSINVASNFWGLIKNTLLEDRKNEMQSIMVSYEMAVIPFSLVSLRLNKIRHLNLKKDLLCWNWWFNGGDTNTHRVSTKTQGKKFSRTRLGTKQRLNYYPGWEFTKVLKENLYDFLNF